MGTKDRVTGHASQRVLSRDPAPRIPERPGAGARGPARGALRRCTIPMVPKPWAEPFPRAPRPSPTASTDGSPSPWPTATGQRPAPARRTTWVGASRTMRWADRAITDRHRTPLPAAAHVDPYPRSAVAAAGRSTSAGPGDGAGGDRSGAVAPRSARRRDTDVRRRPGDVSPLVASTARGASRASVGPGPDAPGRRSPGPPVSPFPAECRSGRGELLVASRRLRDNGAVTFPSSQKPELLQQESEGPGGRSRGSTRGRLPSTGTCRRQPAHSPPACSWP